jgi:predicted TIM-barrel fold metal-dependent hydrolase
VKIIDAHTHVIEHIAGIGQRGELRPIGRGKARWANGEVITMIPAYLGDREFTGETLVGLLDEYKVEKAVLLQGSFYGFQNEYTCEVAKKYPDRFAAACTFDPFSLQADALLDRFLHKMKFPIVKFETSSGGGLMGYHKPFAIDGEVFAAIFETIAAQGQTLVLDIGSPGMASFQPEAIANVAKKYHKMKVVVCHLLSPTLADTKVLEDGLRLLKLENVWLDLAAIPWNVAPEQYPYETGRSYVKLAKEIVGAGKLIWGSDVPSPLTRDSYTHLIDYITTANIFSEAELEDVFYNNACSVYPFSK